MSDDGHPAQLVRAAGGALVCLLIAFPCFRPVDSARAEDPTAESEGLQLERADYNTPRFSLHTDLPEGDAKALLQRLDVTLKSAARFFGTPPRESIESYVVARLDHWPAESFTHPAARLLIGGVGGGSVTNAFDETATAPRKVTVFAAALPGIAEHEIVHAYCVQTFGLTGPTWFSEGIAEVLASGAPERAPVQCPSDVFEYLRGEEPRSLAEIIGGEEFTAPLAASLVLMLEHHDTADRTSDVASMDRWNKEQTELVRTARLSYHWCWSACHFLHHHPAYNGRFRLLGRGYVAGQSVDFDEMFAPVRDRLEFEYRFFMDRLEPGYRVDLCAWDWEDPCPPKSGNQQQSVKVVAPRGYQATGLSVRTGETVTYEAKGEWRLANDGDALDADGDGFGQGQLEGILFHEGALSEPLVLGQHGRFTAPGPGKLYLRCRDAWGELADNRGTIRVRLRQGEAGN